MIKTITHAWVALLVLVCCGYSTIQAQRTTAPPKDPAQGMVNYQPTTFLKFDPQKTPQHLRNADQLLKSQFQLTPSDALKIQTSIGDELGYIHHTYQQFYKGIRVEYGLIKLHTLHDNIVSLSGEFKATEQIVPTPTISEATARTQALSHVGAQIYMWENSANELCIKNCTSQPQATFYPSGDLVIVDNYTSASREPVLAWKFDIYAEQPMSRAYIYVDAHTGKVVHNNPIIKHALGDFATRYSGQQQGETESNSTGFKKFR